MGKVDINMHGDTDGKTIEISGNMHGTIKDFAMVAGFLLGHMLIDAPAGAEESAFNYLLKGMASAKFGDNLGGEFSQIKIPKSVIHEINKEGENGHD